MSDAQRCYETYMREMNDGIFTALMTQFHQLNHAEQLAWESVARMMNEKNDPATSESRQ